MPLTRKIAVRGITECISAHKYLKGGVAIDYTEIGRNPGMAQRERPPVIGVTRGVVDLPFGSAMCYNFRLRDHGFEYSMLDGSTASGFRLVKRRHPEEHACVRESRITVLQLIAPELAAELRRLRRRFSKNNTHIHMTPVERLGRGISTELIIGRVERRWASKLGRLPD